MSEPSVASAFEGKNPVTDFGDKIVSHYKDAVTSDKDAFAGETAMCVHVGRLLPYDGGSAIRTTGRGDSTTST